MKNILKWILVVGACLSGLLLMGTLIFNTGWIDQSAIPFGHGMINGGHHSTFGGWASYGWLIFGVFFCLLVIAGLLLVIRSKPETNPASGVRSDPLENCPACDADLEPNWNHCPSCGYDLS
jgi:hypothetical protein